jgi:hypothetical protein
MHPPPKPFFQPFTSASISPRSLRSQKFTDQPPAFIAPDSFILSRAIIASRLLVSLLGFMLLSVTFYCAAFRFAFRRFTSGFSRRIPVLTTLVPPARLPGSTHTFSLKWKSPDSLPRQVRTTLGER